MANMALFSTNLYATTTQILVNNNSDGVQFLFDKNVGTQYTTNGYTGSTTAATISIEFDEPLVISGIIIKNHNMRNFTVFYNSSTGNAVLTATGYSATSTYISFASVTANSIQIDNTCAQTATERSIGEVFVSEKLLTFERNPSHQDYQPAIDRKQILHEMPDGGVVLYNIKDKYRTTLKWDFITSSFYNSLLDIYQDQNELHFVPEPTSTAWNGLSYNVVWVGDFDFKYSTNDKVQGYGGKILLRETPSA